jgi:hypothetical protein
VLLHLQGPTSPTRQSDGAKVQGLHMASAYEWVLRGTLAGMVALEQGLGAWHDSS